MHGRHWTRLAFGLWIILLGVVCIRPLFKPMSSTVFPIYAFAGSDFAAGEPLYAKNHPGADIFRYSPLVAAGFAPLALLPPGAGGALWRILGATLFLSGLAAWARRACPQAPLPLVFLVALPFSIGSLSNGQANVHILGLMLWGAVLATRGWWGAAGTLIATAALFKGYPIALGMLLALAAPIRHGLPLALTIAAGFALPFFLQSHEYISAQYSQWFEAVSGDDRTAFPFHLGYQDAHMLLRVLGFNLSLAEFRLIQIGVGAAAGGVIAGQVWRGVPREEVALNALTLALCWMTTFGPGIESSTFILLAPVAARELLDGRNQPRWARPLAIAGGGLYLICVTLFAFPHEVHRPVVALGILPVAALSISGAALGRVFAARAQARPAPAADPIPVLRAA